MTPTCLQCGGDLDPNFNVCHDCDARLVIWLTGAHPPIRGRWRRRARDVMQSVVKAYRNAHETIDADELIKLVDDAYPFGERAMAPYKAWLAERKELIAVLKPEKLSPVPTAEDYAACEVAIDLVETGREDDARALLDEQAPRRLNRKCPACKAKVGEPCFEVEATTSVGITDLGIKTASGVRVLLSTKNKDAITDRIVPHLARVEPQRPAPMPLFERSEA